jgi:hypothetical protein
VDFRRGSAIDRTIETESLRAGYSSLSRVTRGFLCLGGLDCLFGMMRSGGGRPTPRRARRRASRATLRRGFFRRAICELPLEIRSHLGRVVKSNVSISG